MAITNNNNAIYNFAVKWLFSTNHKDIGTLYPIFILTVTIFSIIVFPIEYLSLENLYIIKLLFFVKLFLFISFLLLLMKLKNVYNAYFHLVIFYCYLPLLKLFSIIQLLFIFSYISIGCLNLSIICLNALAPLLTLIAKSGFLDLNTVYCADNQSLSDEENSSLSLRSVNTETNSSNNTAEIDHEGILKVLSGDSEAQLQYVVQHMIFKDVPDLKNLLSIDDFRYVFLDRGPNVYTNVKMFLEDGLTLEANGWYHDEGPHVGILGPRPWPDPTDPKFERIKSIFDSSLEQVSGSSSVSTNDTALFRMDIRNSWIYSNPTRLSSFDILDSANNLLSEQNFEITRDLWAINYASEQQRAVDFDQVFSRLNNIFSNLRLQRYNEHSFWDGTLFGIEPDIQWEALKRFSHIFLQQGPNPNRQLALLNRTFFPYASNLDFNWTELRQALFLEEGFMKKQAFDKLQTVLDRQVFSSIYERYPDTGGYALAWVLEVWLGVLKQQRQSSSIEHIYTQLDFALRERFSIPDQVLNDTAYTPRKVREVDSFLNELNQLQRNFEENPNQNNTGLKIQGLAILHHKVDSESHPELAGILKRLTEVFPTEEIELQQRIVAVENSYSLSEILIHSGFLNDEETRDILQGISLNSPNESQIMNHLEHVLSLQVEANPFHQWALLEETFFPLVTSVTTSSDIHQALFSTGPVADQKLEELCQTLHVEDLTPSTQALKQVLQTWKNVLSQRQENKQLS